MAQTKVKQKQQTTVAHEFAYGVGALLVSYGLISWAIDSGSILVYVMFAISAYYALRSFQQAVKLQFFHDKTTATRAVKKAHRN